MADQKLPASRFAKVPKVIRAIELVFLPKRLAIFAHKERQEAAGWSANTQKPIVAFKVKNPKQASQVAARYLVQLSQQGHQIAVAKDIRQLTTVTKDPSAPASVDEPVEDGEDKGVDKRTSFVRKLILQAFREQKKDKSEGIMSDGHEHLHRLVEANEQEQAAKRDPLHTFRVLSGVRSVRPSLEEALTGVTEHEKRLSESVETEAKVETEVDEAWGSDPLPHHGLAKVMPGQSKKKGKPMTVTTHTGGKTTMRTVSEQKGFLTTKRAVVESAHGEKVSQAAACAKKAWAKALKGKDPKNARSAVWKAVKAEFPEFESDTKLMNSLVDDTKPKH
jgi:hypothetical protein